ncbi:porin family protein [Phyllobacterium salinisoli]|uniref:Porin family protein n=1 Tax=Phyllobacterium salinisoli TaxID=1899321 RepID=A0A368K6P7_9HYPH|nr:outer membrane protein [Phyllobacterium salinisoli]RCS23720.1 porin family protein [Phyllobacterium salinisoli]
MQNRSRNFIAGAVFLAAAGVSHSAFAADITEPMPEAPMIPEVAVPASIGGWYLRGDVGYSWAKFREASYATSGCDECGGGGIGENQLDGDLKGSFLIGGGIGYQVTDYFRTDLTVDYLTRSKFSGETFGTCTSGGVAFDCTSTDSSKLSALSILANAYVDLGNFNGFTPYVGAGIGGTRVKWSALENTIGGDFDQSGTETHAGAASWRFTWALMAGVSVDLTQNLKLDAGYRYRRVEGGNMFAGSEFVGKGYDDGLSLHDVRVGLRYQFGGPSTVAYAPEPLPVYK